MKQEIGAPSGEHSSCFDTAFGFAGAHEVKSEAADDGHVLGAVALSIAGEIVLELQVENPVHGLNAPVTADRRGDAVDLKGERGDIDAGLAMALTGLLGGSVNLNQGFDGRKAGLPRISAVGGDPVDLRRGPILAGLYAPMALFQGRRGDHLVGRSAAKVVEHVGFEGRLIGFEAEHILGAMIDDLLSDRCLAAHRIDGDDGPVQLAGIGQGIEQIGDGGDLIGFSGTQSWARVRRALVA